MSVVEDPTGEREHPPPVAGRIALVTPQYWPAVGGVELHVERIATLMASRGQSVDVLATDPTGHLPRFATSEGVRVRRFGTIPKSGGYFLSPALGRWLQRNAARYAVIHAHSYHTPIPLLSALATRRHRVPMVITPHYHGGGHTPFARLLHTFYRTPGKWALQQAAAVICVSEAERSLLVGQLRIGNTEVIPNGVDAVAVDHKAQSRSTTAVIAVARAEPYKHLETVIDAMVLLPAKFRLTIVTTGPGIEALKARAAATLGTHRVCVLSDLARPELEHRYAQAGIFVSLSEREAFGLAPLEAASAGCALVLSDIPAHREISGMVDPDAAYFVANPATATAAARAIEHAANGPLPSVAPRLPTWSEAADATMRIYGRVVA